MRRKRTGSLWSPQNEGGTIPGKEQQVVQREEGPQHGRAHDFELRLGRALLPHAICVTPRRAHFISLPTASSSDPTEVGLASSAL